MKSDKVALEFMAKTYRTQIEVRGYELDSFGHVNNSVYLNYLEHARWRMLAMEGITLEEISRKKQWPVIASIHIRYLKPAFLGDELEIRTRIIEHSRVRFTFEQEISRGETPIASATVESVIVDARGRPTEIHSDYCKLWSD